MKHRVYLTLTDTEIESLKNLLKSSTNSNLNSLVKLQIEKENKDEYIQHNVYLALSDISGIPTDEISNSNDLKLDLGLSLYHKKALKSYFQNIVNALNSTKKISVTECSDLKKVIDCIKLVKSKV
jgi:hypothetical protein